MGQQKLMYIHTYNFAAYLRTVEHFWLFSKTGRIVGISMAFFRQTGKEPTTYQEVKWANIAHVHTYIQLCGISGHSGAFLTVFKNWENCGNFNGFLLPNWKRTNHLSRSSMGQQKLMYIHTYVQLCGISAHSGPFLSVFKNFGNIAGISMAFFTKPEKSLSKSSMSKQKLMHENYRYLIFAAYVPICAQWSIFLLIEALLLYALVFSCLKLLSFLLTRSPQIFTLWTIQILRNLWVGCWWVLKMAIFCKRLIFVHNMFTWGQKMLRNFWQLPWHQYTHAILSFPCSFLAVNHHDIKNWVPPILTHNLWLIFMRKKQKRIIFFFLKKK